MHPPSLRLLTFARDSSIEKDSSPLLQSLLNISNDNDLVGTFPSFKPASLVRRPEKKTQLKKFVRKAQHVEYQLGSWASERFIVTSIRIFKDAMRANGEKMVGWSSMEKDSVMESLQEVDITTYFATHSSDTITNTSAKFECLLEALLKEYDASFCGLIFVEQRVMVLALSQLLSIHPRSRNIFRCKTFIGMSSDTKRKTELGDLLNRRDQLTTLDDFRQGSINLIIATNALEEGIDVSACNNVFCFDDLPNLKSFVQRRGRARAENSNFFVLSSKDNGGSLEKLRAAEEEMIKRYQDDKRLRGEFIKREGIQEDSKERFVVKSTGFVNVLQNIVTY